MPAVELPNGQSAILYSRDEISERTARSISRAYMVAGSTAAKLVGLGYNDTDPTTWNVYSELTEDEQNNIDGYEAALIVGMVREWTLGAKPTLESVYDLPRLTFKELADACSNEYNGVEEFGPDGVDDPKAPTDASPN